MEIVVVVISCSYDYKGRGIFVNGEKEEEMITCIENRLYIKIMCL